VPGVGFVRVESERLVLRRFEVRDFVPLLFSAMIRMSPGIRAGSR
jgi:hypothetical protein